MSEVAALRTTSVIRLRETSPVLADAAHVLSDRLERRLEALTRLLEARLDQLESRFLDRLEKLKFDARQRRALNLITLGAAVRLLRIGGEKPLFAFLEQVEYNGRRLAKLNLHPSLILQALAEYDRLLVQMLDRGARNTSTRFRWAREQVHYCVVLTLNNSYFQVREAEISAQNELFRVETESRSLADLLEGSMAVLARYCRAEAAQVFLLDEAHDLWKPQVKASALEPIPATPQRRKTLARPFCFIAGEVKTNSAVLDRGWLARYPTCWSMPLANGRRLAAVMQFAFAKPYEWLPREQDMLTLVAERCLVGAEKIKLMENLSESEEQVRHLASRMLQVEEVERRRISRELHDEAGQSLLCVRLQLEMVEQMLGTGGGPEATAEALRKLTEVREVTENTILEIRRLISALSPAVLEQLGLGPALRQLVSRYQRMHPAARVRLSIGLLGTLPKKTESIVYRLVQECMNNIAKHSGAQRVNISLDSVDGILHITVEDDGIGFRVEEAYNKRDSFGLAGLRERVALLGGLFQVESRPRAANRAGEPKRASSRRAQSEVDFWRAGSSGTRIRMELPVPAEIAAATA